ncbi:cell division protein FtsA [Siphonobacter sp. BAB-5385]|uniref:cell division protein FtsA n=1 Tax=unclassified Siphonobacter TaxID=2635712 RepID=UPI000B9E1E6B|nr:MULTISPECIES: cell division protein FtsA [unclassified Siphonobacter]OZI05554.1 cell division protein FtsA [Siphonobacter sp. BAB-5385]PMD95886.1 cell division protein FtsA [Siphonobacter sp. BAB-5405]
MEKKIVCGIDVGTTKVCVVIGQQDHDEKLDVRGVSRVEFKDKKFKNLVTKGAILNPDFVSKFIKKALAEAIEQAGVTPNQYFISVASHQVACIPKISDISRDYVSEGDEVRHDDLQRLLGSVGRTKIDGSAILHVLPQEYSVDGDSEEHYHIVGVTGTHLRGKFQVITMPLKPLSTLLKSLDWAGLSNIPPKHVYLASLASTMAVLSDEEKEHGAILVDIGAGKTDVVIVQGELVRYVASFPVGGKAITKDIEIGCDVSENVAEDLKLRFGTATHKEVRLNEVVAVPNVLESLPPKNVSLKNVAVIIEARVKDIATFVAAVVRHAGYERKIKTGIVLTGGGARLDSIQEVFRSVTGMHVQVGRPNQGFNKQKPETTNNLSYATALGLVRLGFRSLDPRDELYESLVSVPSPIQAPVPTRPHTYTTSQHHSPMPSNGSNGSNGSYTNGNNGHTPRPPEPPRNPETKEPTKEPEPQTEPEQEWKWWRLRMDLNSWYKAIFRDEFESRNGQRPDGWEPKTV